MRIHRTSTEPVGHLPGRKHDLKCGDCGSIMEMHKSSKKFGNGDFRHYYRCANWPTCKGAIGAHPDGRPLGIPANQETRNWRIRAHEVFDKLHRGKDAPFTRDEAYAWLQGRMGLSSKEAHIACLDIDQCKQLILLVTIWLEVYAIERYHMLDRDATTFLDEDALCNIANGEKTAASYASDRGPQRWRELQQKIVSFFKGPTSSLKKERHSESIDFMSFERDVPWGDGDN